VRRWPNGERKSGRCTIVPAYCLERDPARKQVVVIVREVGEPRSQAISELTGVENRAGPIAVHRAG